MATGSPNNSNGPLELPLEKESSSFGMGDTLAKGSSQAVSIKAARNKHGKGGGARPKMHHVGSPMKEDSSKQLIALEKAKSKRTRRPRNGARDIRGLPKKGGAGGKGVWGKLTDLYDDSGVGDARDPNYDSNEEEDFVVQTTVPPLEPDDFGGTVMPILKEYFCVGDTGEVVDALSELNLGGLQSDVVYLAVAFAMEQKPTVRELTSILISDMLDSVVADRHVVKGFNQLLDDLDDLVLDTPDAVEVLGKFIARAIADDCLPPAFADIRNRDMSKLSSNKHARACLSHAHTLLSMKHGMVRLDSVWGSVGGGLRPVKVLDNEMTLLLQEYLSSGQVDEAMRCVRELEVPHFHHELVYLLVLMVIEDGKPENAERMAALLQEFSTSVLITPDQIKRGFHRIYDNVDDIVLDVPYAYQVLSSFATRCLHAKIITQELYAAIPARGRRRFVSDSEGDISRVENC